MSADYPQGRAETGHVVMEAYDAYLTGKKENDDGEEEGAA